MEGVFTRAWRLIETLAYTVCSTLFRLFGKDLSNEDFEVILQFIKFGIVGVSNVLVSYLVYVGSLFILRKLNLGSHYDNYIALAVAYIVSVFWSFLWNNALVFKKQDGEHRVFWKALLKTYATYFFTGVILNQTLLYIWLNVVSISEFVAPLLNSMICIPINFILNKFWAFNDRRNDE